MTFMRIHLKSTRFFLFFLCAFMSFQSPDCQEFLNTSGLYHNPKRVANYVNANIESSNTDLENVVSTINALPTFEQKSALNQMHPALFESLAMNTAYVTHTIRSMWIDRLNFTRNHTQADVCKPYLAVNVGPWIAGAVSYIRQSQVDGLRRFNATNQAVSFGYDKEICQSAVVGLGGGYSHSRVRWNKQGNSDAHAYYIGGYATQYNEDYYLDGSFIGFVDHYYSSRHIDFSSINRHAKSNHYAYGFSPHLGIGFYYRYKGIELEPFFDIEYFYIQQNRLRERHASSLNLHVKRNRSSIYRVESGLRISESFNVCSGILIPSGTISWVGHRLVNGHRYRSHFEGINNFFSVWGTKHCFNQLELGLGLNYVINNKLSLNIWADAELGKSRQAQEAHLDINYQF